MKKPSGNFYAQPTEASRRKQRIVTKYHAAWSRVLRSPQSQGGRSQLERDLGYVDLFAGQGKYDSGDPSTPLLIIEAAAKDPYMREHLIMKLNEGDPAVADILEKNIDESAAAKELQHYPKVTHALVESDILSAIGGIPAFPTLLFADPWGYKGLSVKLLTKFLQPFGNDLIFFFNYNRIASALHAQVLEEPIDAVFGKDVADSLRWRIAEKTLKGADKEREIMNALAAAFAPAGAQTPVQFPFQTKGRLSHHLMFVSKHPLGNEIMKGVMWGESSPGTYGFNDALDGQPLLFDDMPIQALAQELLNRFAGRSVHFSEIGVDKHAQFGVPAHKRALQTLEQAERVTVLSYTKARHPTKDGLSVPNDAILVFNRGRRSWDSRRRLNGQKRPGTPSQDVLKSAPAARNATRNGWLNG